VVGCGLSRVLSEERGRPNFGPSSSPLLPPPPPTYPVRLQIRQHIQVRASVQRQKAKRNGTCTFRLSWGLRFGAFG
jgi:hypothetical protein